jgi:hypothetical protein
MLSDIILNADSVVYATKWAVPFKCSNYRFLRISLRPHACYMCCPFYLTSFDILTLCPTPYFPFITNVIYNILLSRP